MIFAAAIGAVLCLLALVCDLLFWHSMGLVVLLSVLTGNSVLVGLSKFPSFNPKSTLFELGTWLWNLGGFVILLMIVVTANQIDFGWVASVCAAFLLASLGLVRMFNWACRVGLPSS